MRRTPNIVNKYELQLIMGSVFSIEITDIMDAKVVRIFCPKPYHFHMWLQPKHMNINEKATPRIRKDYTRNKIYEHDPYGNVIKPRFTYPNMSRENQDVLLTNHKLRPLPKGVIQINVVHPCHRGFRGARKSIRYIRHALRNCQNCRYELLGDTTPIYFRDPKSPQTLIRSRYFDMKDDSLSIQPDATFRCERDLKEYPQKYKRLVTKITKMIQNVKRAKKKKQAYHLAARYGRRMISFANMSRPSTFGWPLQQFTEHKSNMIVTGNFARGQSGFTKSLSYISGIPAKTIKNSKVRHSRNYAFVWDTSNLPKGPGKWAFSIRPISPKLFISQATKALTTLKNKAYFRKF